MSSCVASCCTCFPKASFAFATLASSPTAAVPLCCRFACKHSTRCSHRPPNREPLLRRNLARSGSVPNVAAPWWSSRDLPLPSSNSVLHPCSPEPLHETKIPSSLTRCRSPPAGVVRPSCPQTSCPLPTPAETIALTPRKLQPNQSYLCFRSVQYLFPTPLS